MTKGLASSWISGRVNSAIRRWVTGQHRIWFTAIPGTVALVLLLMTLVPFLLDADTFRLVIEKQMAESIHRPVKLGKLSFSLFTTSLVAANVTIGDDPQYSLSPFLTAKALHIGVQAWPLLSRRQVVITRFVVDEPQVHLVHALNGTWNFSSLTQKMLGSPASASGTASTTTIKTGTLPANASVPDLAGAKLQLRNGTVIIENLLASGRPLVYQDVQLTARQVSAKQQFPFHVLATIPGGGSVTFDGTAGPVASGDFFSTPVKATLSLKNFDPVSAGLLKPSQGISLSADLTAQVASDGRNVSAIGTVRASHLQLAKNGAPSAQPVNATFDVAGLPSDARAGPTATQIKIRDLSVMAGTNAAHVTGTVTLLSGRAVLNARLAAERLPLDDLRTLLPSVGVRLPRGASLQGGNVTANLAITGAATAAEFSGPIDVENTSLSGFNIGSKLNGLAALGVVPGDSTPIQSLKTDVVVGPDGVVAQNVYAALPSLGTVTGSGTVSASGALDFHLLVKLGGRAAGTAPLGIVSVLSGLLGGAATSAISDGVPVTITGTQQHPRIRLALPLVGAATSAEQGGDKGLQHLRRGRLLQNLLGGRR